MISDELGKQLHDHATRGEVLSVEEQSQLSEWYAAQDQTENDLLNAGNPVSSTSELQKWIGPMLRQLANSTRRIREITSENDALRGGIAELRRQIIPVS